MAELGLVPNATLHLKSTAKPSPPTTLNIPSDMAQAIKVMTAGSSSGMLGSSQAFGGGSALGLHGGIGSEFGSSVIGSSGVGVSGLESHPLLSGIGSGLPPTFSPNIGLGQFYGATGMSPAVAAAAAASLSKQSAPQSTLPSVGIFSCVGNTIGGAAAGLIGSCMPSFAVPPSNYTLSSAHSSPRSQPPATPAHFTGAAYHPSPTPRRSPSPALPVIPPNLHPALTPTLPQLCLPDDSEGSSSDAS